MQKQDSSFFCIQETHLNLKEKCYLRVKGWKKIFQANEPKKQAGVAILMFKKINSKLKSIKRDEKDTSYSSQE